MVAPAKREQPAAAEGTAKPAPSPVLAAVGCGAMLLALPLLALLLGFSWRLLRWAAGVQQL